MEYYSIILVGFVLGQIGTISLGPQVRIHPLDFGIALWGLWHILTKSFWKIVLNDKIAKAFFIFILVCLASLVVNFNRFSFQETLVAFLYLLRFITYFSVYPILLKIIKKKTADKKTDNLYYSLAIAGLLLAVTGLAQYVIFPDLRRWTSYHWDPHYYRAVGTILDPGFLGLILVLTMIIYVEKWPVLKKMFLANKYLLFAALTIVYLAFSLTYSRSSYLAYLVALAAIAFFKKSFRFYLAGLLLLVSTLILLPRSPGGEGVKLERWASIEARLRNWRQSMIIFKDRPILGVGFNNYRYAQRDYRFVDSDNWQETHAGAGADSSIFFVLATTGIIGLAAFLNIFRVILKSIKKRSSIFISFLGAVLSHSFFINSLFYPQVMFLLWSLVALEKQKT